MKQSSGHSPNWQLVGPVLLALCACSHDAPRGNPVDPDLTPPVELQVALDDSAGVVTLRWSPYAGDQPFASYQVERKVQGLESWTALDSLTSASQTSYLDTSLAPATAYDYRVVVANTSGHEQPSERQSVGGFSIGPVSLFPVDPDSELGALVLRWTQYHDPGFEGYVLSRRHVDTGTDSVVAQVSGVADTVFADTTVRHGVSYQYSLLTLASGEQLPSNSQPGRLTLPPSGLSAPTSSRALRLPLSHGRSTPVRAFPPIASSARRPGSFRPPWRR